MWEILMLGILVLGLLVMAVWGVLAYNRLCRLRDLAAEAWRQLSAGLARRAGIESELALARSDERPLRGPAGRRRTENIESLELQRTKADDRVVALRRYYDAATDLYHLQRRVGWGSLYSRLARFSPRVDCESAGKNTGSDLDAGEGR